MICWAPTSRCKIFKTFQKRETYFNKFPFFSHYLHCPSYKMIQLWITAKYFFSGRQCFQYLRSTFHACHFYLLLCQNGDVLVLKAFSDKCSGIHWFKTNFLASIQVNSCHKNGCAKFDWSVPTTQFHITPLPVLPTMQKIQQKKPRNLEKSPIPTFQKYCDCFPIL